MKPAPVTPEAPFNMADCKNCELLAQRKVDIQGLGN